MAKTLKSDHDAGDEEKPKQNKLTKAQAAKAFRRLDDLYDAMESEMGERMSDIKAAFEEIAKETNMPRAILRHEYSHRRKEKKRLAKEKDMESSEREHLDMLRNALGQLKGTPLGDHAEQTSH
jgi:chromatin segregation and condensation protein Rec8/ScpA/Scc1 (kleisin family)